jgi:hypothetical protein
MGTILHPAAASFANLKDSGKLDSEDLESKQDTRTSHYQVDKEQSILLIEIHTCTKNLIYSSLVHRTRKTFHISVWL